MANPSLLCYAIQSSQIYNNSLFCVCSPDYVMMITTWMLVAAVLLDSADGARSRKCYSLIRNRNANTLPPVRKNI